MAGKFRLTPEADSQLGHILEFIAHESESGAMRVRHAVYDALEQLVRMPQMGHTRQDLTDRPLKFWSVYSYLIVYDPATSPLVVVAILHGAQDVEQLLKKI
jgi:plasmid stabilization system protein ParE